MILLFQTFGLQLQAPVLRSYPDWAWSVGSSHVEIFDLCQLNQKAYSQEYLKLFFELMMSFLF